MKLLRNEHRLLKEALIERYMQAETDEARASLPDVNHGPWHQIKPKVVQAGREFAGTPAAVPFLLWTIQASTRTSQQEEAVLAIDRLIEDHADDPRLEEMAYDLRRYVRSLGREGALERAWQIDDSSPHFEVKAAARLAAIQIEGLHGKERIQALRELVEFSPDSASGRDAASWIFELENLQVGMQVPDVVGTTVDGQPFRLSELRGKVVILEFWSIYCGPCLQKIPTSIARVERLRDAPFAHIGVHSASPPVDKVAEVIEEREIPWPIVMDQAKGSSFGPIGTQWRLSGWPTVYLIDHEGVIRSNWATQDVLDKLLPDLIEKAKAQ